MSLVFVISILFIEFLLIWLVYYSYKHNQSIIKTISEIQIVQYTRNSIKQYIELFSNNSTIVIPKQNNNLYYDLIDLYGTIESTENSIYDDRLNIRDVPISDRIDYISSRLNELNEHNVEDILENLFYDIENNKDAEMVIRMVLKKISPIALNYEETAIKKYPITLLDSLCIRNSKRNKLILAKMKKLGCSTLVLDSLRGRNNRHNKILLYQMRKLGFMFASEVHPYYLYKQFNTYTNNNYQLSQRINFGMDNNELEQINERMSRPYIDEEELIACLHRPDKIARWLENHDDIEDYLKCQFS